MNIQPKNATRTQGERREERKQKSILANTHLNRKKERTIGDAKRGERGRRKEEYKHKQKEGKNNTHKHTIQAMLFFFKL